MSQKAYYDYIPEPVVLLTPALEIYDLNQAAEQFWGRSRVSMLGTKLSDLLGPNQELEALCQRVQASGTQLRGFDVSVDRRFMGDAFCEVSASVMDNEGRILLLMLQRTNNVQSMSPQISGRASEGLHHLVSMLAHEIKNPLAGIKGAGQLLSMSAKADDLGLVELIIEETHRLTALVDQFDFFSNSIETEANFVNIHEVLLRVEGIATNSFGKHVRFNRVYDPSLPEIWGDRDRLVQVLLNLVKNACEALDGTAGGVVELKTRFQHSNVILLDGGEPISAPLQVEVCDNGPGIPSEIQSQVFEPFRSGKLQGTGLGLSIVTKILADHSGAVEFKSQPGETRFTLSFPMIKKTALAGRVDLTAYPAQTIKALKS